MTGVRTEAFLFQPFRFEQPGLIFCTTIAQYSDNGVPAAQFERNAHGRCDIDAARTAQEEAFLAQEAIHKANRIGIFDVKWHRRSAHL